MGALAVSLAVFALVLLLSAIALAEYSRVLGQEKQQLGLRTSERMLTALRDQLQTCDLLMRSIQALFLGDPGIDREKFLHTYQLLQLRERFPGLQAVVFSRKRVDGTTFAYPTELVAPLAGNESVVGLDVVSQPHNLLALQRARDLDQAVMSASFRLIQRSGLAEPVDGILIRLPAFSPGRSPLDVEERRAREIGSIGVSFRVSALIQQGLTDMSSPLYAVRVTDITDGSAVLLYDSADDGMSQPRSTAAPILGRVEYGQRVWELALQPVQHDGAEVDSLRWGAAVALLLALLFGLLVWTLSSRREHAERAAVRLHQRYRESEFRFRSLSEVLPVAVVLSHCGDDRIDYINLAGRRLLALGDVDPSEHRLSDFVDVRAQAGRSEVTDQPGPLDTAQALRPLHGESLWVTLAQCEFAAEDTTLQLTVISDVTELRELTARLGYQASHDSLTGLINRAEFERQLDRALKRNSVRGCGVLYLDLDQFKLINDVSGHLAGDALLSQLGRALQGVLGKRDQIARLGGDEFGVLIHDGAPAAVLHAAESLRQTIADVAFCWDGTNYRITASIGAVLMDGRRPTSRRELLSLADTACYMAKEAGRNRVHLFSEQDAATSSRLLEMQWVGRLRQALTDDRLCLYYQELQPLNPAVAVPGAHFELLVRLRDEQGELVAPAAFVPAAERFGLMPLLDRWVVKTALMNFSALHPAGDQVAMCAINLSGTTMEDEAFPAFVFDQLKRSGVPAERLCFEVTETAAIANMARVVELIQGLRALGCRFALDDFGAGMSSFGYLKDLPVDFIKIDGCFIREIETDPMSYAIVRAVTDIGHHMGAQVIAEFVNSERTCEQLRELGVDYAQGYLLHEPEPTGLSERVMP